MTTGYSYQLVLVAPNNSAARDITQLVQTLTWSGSAQQIARELSGSVVIRRDSEPIDLAEGSILALVHNGEQRFVGPLVSVTTSSQSSIVDISALDRGRYLVGNEGWYSFTDAYPEDAAATIAADFGITVDSLVKTGVKVSRKFAGVALDLILTSLYALAGEKNGKKYHVGFGGNGRLSAAERPTTANFEISSTMGVTNTWDIAGLQNSVAIYTDVGTLVRREEDSASVALNGRLEHVIKQTDGDDATASAKAWLSDHGLTQTLTVETLGDPRLVTGEAVLLRDKSGVSGLFWIESDTHTWKNRQYFTKVTLSFKELVAASVAGSEVS